MYTYYEYVLFSLTHKLSNTHNNTHKYDKKKDNMSCFHLERAIGFEFSMIQKAKLYEYININERVLSLPTTVAVVVGVFGCIRVYAMHCNGFLIQSVLTYSQK